VASFLVVTLYSGDTVLGREESHQCLVALGNLWQARTVSAEAPRIKGRRVSCQTPNRGGDFMPNQCRIQGAIPEG
jgi:hypothetical protein